MGRRIYLNGKVQDLSKEQNNSVEFTFGQWLEDKEINKYFPQGKEIDGSCSVAINKEQLKKTLKKVSRDLNKSKFDRSLSEADRQCESRYGHIIKAIRKTLEFRKTMKEYMSKDLSLILELVYIQEDEENKDGN